MMHFPGRPSRACYEPDPWDERAPPRRDLDAPRGVFWGVIIGLAFWAGFVIGAVML